MLRLSLGYSHPGRRLGDLLGFVHGLLYRLGLVEHRLNVGENGGDYLGMELEVQVGEGIVIPYDVVGALAECWQRAFCPIDSWEKVGRGPSGLDIRRDDIVQPLGAFVRSWILGADGLDPLDVQVIGNVDAVVNLAGT